MDKFKTSPKLAGYLFAVIATMIWSGNYIVARELNQSVPPVSLAFWRWFVASAVFLPLAFRTLVDEWTIIRGNLAYLSITAFLGVSAFNTLLYFAAHTSSAINLSLISITSPIFIVILARLFLGDALTFYKGTGILLVVAGVVLLVTRGDLSTLLNLSIAIGDVWMLIAALAFAIYSILIIRKPAQLSIWAFQLSTFILGLFFLVPFFIWETVTVAPAVYSAGAIYSIIYLGVFASLVSYLLWNRSVLLIGASKTAMTYYTMPLFSGVLAYFFLDETIGLFHLVSGLLIVSGILIANYNKTKSPADA